MNIKRNKILNWRVLKLKIKEKIKTWLNLFLQNYKNQCLINLEIKKELKKNLNKMYKN